MRSILVALLVLHLATMQCEAELFGICFLKCMPQCMTGKPITEVATCTGTCLMSCILPDHRITTKTQYSCSLGCANSACSHLINTKDEQGNSFHPLI